MHGTAEADFGSLAHPKRSDDGSDCIPASLRHSLVDELGVGINAYEFAQRYGAAIEIPDECPFDDESMRKVEASLERMHPAQLPTSVIELKHQKKQRLLVLHHAKAMAKRLRWDDTSRLNRHRYRTYR